MVKLGAYKPLWLCSRWCCARGALWRTRPMNTRYKQMTDLHDTLSDFARSRDTPRPRTSVPCYRVLLVAFRRGRGTLWRRLRRYQQDQLLDGAQEVLPLAFFRYGNLCFADVAVLALKDGQNSPDWPIVAIGSFLLQEDHISDVEVSARFLPLLPRLEGLEVFASPAQPELVCQVLNTSPSSAGVQVWWLKVTWWWAERSRFHGQEHGWWQRLGVVYVRWYCRDWPGVD